MQRYIVFLKQVPQSTKVALDPVTKTLKRSSALTRVNPDDLYALQAALDLRSETGAEVIAVSMGPASAEAALREALQRGADKAVLLSSPAFAGSDTWCTAFVLAAAVQKIGTFNLLFFGRMAIDGDTAQVGPEVAGMLDIPQITALRAIERVGEHELTIIRKAGNTLQQIEVTGPCALMVSREYGELTCPTLSGWRRAQQQQILRWNEADLRIDAASVGLQASPTRVISVTVPQNTKRTVWISDANEMGKVLRTIIHSSLFQSTDV